MTEPKVPTPALEGLMKKVFIDQAVEPGLFWDALLNSVLFVPIKTPPSGTPPQEITEMPEIPIVLGEDSGGEVIFWLFTSPEVLMDYIESVLSYVRMDGLRAMKLVSEKSHNVILIGPERLTLRLDRELVKSLAKGEVPEAPKPEVRNIPKDAQIQVGSPSEKTEKLEACFMELFPSLDNIIEGAFVQVSDLSGSRLLLGLKLIDESKEEFKKVANRIAKSLEGVLEKGRVMDITLIRGSLEGAFEKHGKVFYKK